MMALQLDLFEDVASLPWYGRSPRSLTRGALALIFKARAQKDDCFFVDPEQLELFAVATKVRLGYQGAPTLFALPRRRHERQ